MSFGGLVPIELPGDTGRTRACAYGGFPTVMSTRGGMSEEEINVGVEFVEIKIDGCTYLTWIAEAEVIYDHLLHRWKSRTRQGAG